MSRHSTQQISVVQSYIDRWFGPTADDKQKLKRLLQSKSVEDRLHLLRNVRGASWTNWNLLHKASSVNDRDSVKYMLKAFAPEQIYAVVKLQTSRGSTALHIAAFYGSAEVLSYLLNRLTQQRLDVLKLQNVEGDTALHRVANQKKGNIFQLIRSSVSTDQHRELLNIKNKKQQTVSDVAASEFPAPCTIQALNETNKQVDDLKRDKQEQAKAIESANKQLEAINKQLEETNKQVVETNKQVEDLKGDKKRQTDEIAEQAAELTKLRTDMKEMKETIKYLHKSLKDATGDQEVEEY